MKTDILIVGGGLAGLALARRLHAQGLDFLLVEARDRFGGRILTERSGAGDFDMGPAWFWPGQPRMAAMLDRLNLEAFEQHFDGILSYEDERGRVERNRGFASMQGSYRVQGGLDRLTDGIANQLPGASLLRGMRIVRLKHTPKAIMATTFGGQTLTARRVALALPPRLAAHRIAYSPPLPETAMQAMRALPTWMASQAKAVAVYDTPFWRDDGLSGDAMSRFGPLAEVHDASPARGGPYALFGFVGIPTHARQNEPQLRQQVIAQLVRLFGPKAGHPRAVLIKDWAIDPFTATTADQLPMASHPDFGLPNALDGLWDGQLLFGGTEVASRFGGYLEGALEAAESVASTLGG